MSNDCNIAFESLIDIIDDIYNAHCPIRSRQIYILQRQGKPLITSEVINYIRRRQKFF